MRSTILNEADKAEAEVHRKMAKSLRTNRLSLDTTKRKLEQIHEERRQLIELAFKVMTLEEIGEALNLSKQRVSQILESRLREHRQQERTHGT